MTASQEARKKAIKAIRWMKKNRPTLFNPHYAIRGQAVQDAELSSKMGNTKYSRGPQFKTFQWEPTGRLIGLNRTARILAPGEPAPTPSPAVKRVEPTPSPAPTVKRTPSPYDLGAMHRAMENAGRK